MIALRDYRQDIIADLRAAYGAGARSSLLVAPTGSGKTVLFCYVAVEDRGPWRSRPDPRPPAGATAPDIGDPGRVRDSAWANRPRAGAHH